MSSHPHRRFPSALRTLCGLLLPWALAGCAGTPATDGWVDLFDRSTLSGWKATDFVDSGTVGVRDGILVLEPGKPFTGVNYAGPDLPTGDYEVAIRGARLAGEDFFCCLTVPVGESHCSLVLGGWGGALVGISSIDDMDASENETTQHFEFETGRYYDIRLRVGDNRLQAFIDEARVVDLDLTDHRLSVRWEVEPSRPFGIASYRTRAGFERVRLRRLR